MSDYASALRVELMTASRRRPRRGPIAVGIVALVAVVVAVLAVAGGGSQPAAADVDITHKDGRVVVTLTDRETTPAAIEAATDKAGLDIQVEEIPTGPSAVGRFVGDDQTQGGVDLLELDRNDGTSSVNFSVPEGWKGRLTVKLGREAHGDEMYVAPTNALAKGEPLVCSNVLGQPLANAAERLRGVDGLEVRVLDFRTSSPKVMELSDALDAGLGDVPLTGAYSQSRSDVDLFVGPNPDRAAQEAPPC